MTVIDDYINSKKATAVNPIDEYIAQKKTAQTTNEIQVPNVDEYINQKKVAKQQEGKTFIEKHPNLYGAFGAAQSLIPYIKYIDPNEREQFAKLSTQEQTKDLLMENLETLLYVGSGGLSRAGSSLIARYLPKTAKALKYVTTPVKEWSTLAKTPASEVAAKQLFNARIKIFKKATGSKPTAELMNQWWDDTGLAVENVVTPTATKTATPQIANEPTIAKAEPKAETPAKVMQTGIAEPPKAVETPTPPQLTAVQKVQQAIKKSKGKIREQKQVYSATRSERLPTAMNEWGDVGGEKGFYAGKSKLKGEMPKVDYKGIGSDITQTDVDDLFNMVKESPNVEGFEHIHAANGLATMIEGKSVPQESQIKLLKKIFPQDFVDDFVSNRDTWSKIKDATGQLLNVPRSIMSSVDLSAPLRQGIFLGPSHPVRWGQAFTKSFKLFGSEKYFNAVQESIAQKRTYELMKESGLSLTDIGKSMLEREEAFQSQWVEKIPIIGKGVRASSRAYVGFLNKLRADVFEDLVTKAEKLGLDPENNMTLTKGIANFVNVGSGRGALPESLENAAILLNNVFFSPRLMASRLTLLNPIYYVKQDPFVRKEAVKSLFLFAGAIGTTLGLAKAGGLKVGTDIRSSDFGKIKVGNTRIDMMGGFQQYLRSAGQIISGEYVSSTTGKVLTLGEGYKPLTRWDILIRQAETKEAPVLSFITAIMKGQSAIGEKISIPKEVTTRFTPMMLQDIYGIAKDDPDLLPLSALGIFGVGLQTYKSQQTTKSKGIQPIKPLK